MVALQIVWYICGAVILYVYIPCWTIHMCQTVELANSSVDEV